MGNALAQLTDVAILQIAIQLGLAEQDNLHQLVLVSFQVAEQPDLLKGLHRHALRFLDDDQHTAPGSVLLEQVVLQVLHQQQARRGLVHRQAQLEGDGVEDFL